MEVPLVFVDPTINASASGVGDINFGFKYAFIHDAQHTMSFQFRTYVPTGDSHLGLGTGHVSLEPAFLYHQWLNDYVTVFAEFRDWIPIDGGPNAGNVIRYGVGTAWMVYKDANRWVAPVVEVVGWTCLSGLETVAVDSDDFNVNSAAASPSSTPRSVCKSASVRAVSSASATAGP